MIGRSPAIQRILGLDPGLRVTGFGIVVSVGGRLEYVTSGCIRTPATGLPDRLRVIFEGVREVIASSRPTEVAVEKVFLNANPQSTLALGQARGAAICAAVSAALPVAEYTALQIKQAVVGNGHADKRQVQHMVMRLMRLAQPPLADAADALACAISHANSVRGAGYLVASHLAVRRGRLIPVA